MKSICHKINCNMLIDKKNPNTSELIARSHLNLLNIIFKNLIDKIIYDIHRAQHAHACPIYTKYMDDLAASQGSEVVKIKYG